MHRKVWAAGTQTGPRARQVVVSRPLLSDTGGGGGQIGPPGFWLTHPPTHIRKFFLRKKMKFIKGARTWRSILGTQTFFWPLTHPPTPPPPRYSINQPLSKGLVVSHKAQ